MERVDGSGRRRSRRCNVMVIREVLKEV